MKSTKFFDDLARQLREEFVIDETQQADEFTVRWYMENVESLAYGNARIKLERLVKAGRLTVRRKVRLLNGKRGDVYRRVSGAKWKGKKNTNKADSKTML